MIVDIKKIADQADIIIDGYAILKKDDNQYAVVNINRPGHTTVFKDAGSVVETSMDDIEKTIAKGYLTQGMKYIEEAVA